VSADKIDMEGVGPDVVMDSMQGLGDALADGELPNLRVVEFDEGEMKWEDEGAAGLFDGVGVEFRVGDARERYWWWHDRETEMVAVGDEMSFLRRLHPWTALV